MAIIVSNSYTFVVEFANNVRHSRFAASERGPPGSTPPQHPDGVQHHHHQIQSHILLSELPEPPIPLSEIGPIPPPPMFSTPSPTMVAGRPHMQHKSNSSSNMSMMHPQQIDYNDYDYDDQDDIDGDDIDSEDEYMYQMQQQQNIDTMRVEEIPVKEPMLNAMPKKSALKKKSSGSGSSTPSSNSDAANRPLVVRQDNNGSLK